MTPGEHDLATLLATLDPVLHDGVHVFATAAEPPPGLTPVLTFTEPEGVTLVVPEGQAEGVFPCRWITLRVHSSLAAVGMLAAITAALAAEGIPCNAVSAYFHDHLFVPPERAGDTMRVLRQLSANVQARWDRPSSA
ncbi:ACT domain-containing protein [Herbidospora sp. NEAU-GS84]|uniref:ACT domain-containing protein n=1 Tax=Herbidospora solisilvae TaxID=2696284 RepID=A0A7C9N001_9ACTN|nr:ACT domain-containing protein [Herbidospora solisilvae]NAS20314.1 ACT domain-containing protein [Herbidospora solisilvae]